MRSHVPPERAHAMVPAGRRGKAGGSMAGSRKRAVGETVLRVVPVADHGPALVRTRSHDASQPLRCAGGCSQEVQAGGAAAAAATHTTQRAGRRLPPRVRGFFEQRLDADLSSVRVHADPEAASLAARLGARAFTVGEDIFFAAGQFRPGTAGGDRLLAHELVHTVQQAADRTTRRVQRWAVAGNTATVDTAGDTLGALAVRLGGRFHDWKCIRPVRMRVASAPGKPADFNDRYERYLRIGDQFDVSNLRTTNGASLRLHLFDSGSQWRDALVAQLFYPGTAQSGGDVDVDIENGADAGKTPIQEFLLFGHAGGATMWGGAVPSFEPSTLDPEQPRATYNLAEAGLLPRRCWFTRTAKARAVGCDSASFGQAFANAYLRRGAEIVATTDSVRPFCTGLPWELANLMGDPTGCAWYNQLGFTATAAVTSPVLAGPFSTVTDFHAAGSHWTTVKGKL